MTSNQSSKVLENLHPEVGAGGFAAHDGTIEFYGRIRALLQPDALVVDFGAGRAAWAHEDACSYRRQMRDLRNLGIRFVGCDLDEAINDNPVLEEKALLQPGAALPYDNASIDMVIADYVLEHLSAPVSFAKEIDRILKPGGWLCARTPTKYHYVVLASSLMPRSLHGASLRRAQADRKAEDIFEAHYKINSMSEIRRHFSAERFDNHSYIYCNSPSYHFNRVWIYRLMSAAHAVLPSALQGNLFVFLCKKTAQGKGSSSLN